VQPFALTARSLPGKDHSCRADRANKDLCWRMGKAPRQSAGGKAIYPVSCFWLNKGAYDDVSGDAPKPSGPAPIKPVAEFDEADWLNCLSFKKRHGQWSSEWGPSPGEPGCLVPSHLIVTAVASKGKARGVMSRMSELVYPDVLDSRLPVPRKMQPTSCADPPQSCAAWCWGGSGNAQTERRPMK